MAAKPLLWWASNHTNQISRKKAPSPMEERFPRGTYHDAWEEAHAALVQRRQREFDAAEREFQRRRAALSKAKMMRPPDGVAGTTAPQIDRNGREVRKRNGGVQAVPAAKVSRIRCSATNLRGGNCGCAFGQCKKGNIL
jgi:hypothetical protein